MAALRRLLRRLLCCSLEVSVPSHGAPLLLRHSGLLRGVHRVAWRGSARSAGKSPAPGARAGVVVDQPSVARVFECPWHRLLAGRLRLLRLWLPLLLLLCLWRLWRLWHLLRLLLRRRVPALVFHVGTQGEPTHHSKVHRPDVFFGASRALRVE